MTPPRLARDDGRAQLAGRRSAGRPGAGPRQAGPRQAGPRWLRGLPALARHVVRTMPWAPLLAGCLAGLVLLAVLAYVADYSHAPLGLAQVRVTFLPALAGLAFVARAPLRPLALAAPTPAWVTPALQLLLAAPVLAATVAAQLGLVAHTSPPGHAGPAGYPLLAQLTGWAALVAAAAAICDRGRYADLGGAVAGPAGLVVIAAGWFTPGVSRLLVAPPATDRGATVAWYVITAAALAVIGAALRDPWHRYRLGPRLRRRARRGRRPGPPAPQVS